MKIIFGKISNLGTFNLVSSATKYSMICQQLLQKSTMASMGKLFAPLVLLNPKHKPCYPVRVASRNTISVINNCFKKKKIVQEKLEPLWDDGYGTQTAKDFLEAAKDMIMPDNGPPRWLCPIECGSPIKNSPVLLFLPGIYMTINQEPKKSTLILSFIVQFVYL